MNKKDILDQITKHTLRVACKNLKCSYTTLRYWINKYEIELPSRQSICACCKNGFSQRPHGNPRKLCDECKEKFSSVTAIKTRNRVRFAGSRRKAYVVRKLGGKCSTCGYDKNTAALELHHIDPSQKEFMVNAKTLASDDFSKIEKELLKCRLLCRNCHAEQHFPACSDWKNFPDFW